MNIVTRVDQGTSPVKFPDDSRGRTRRASQDFRERAERNDAVPVVELPVWCVEA